MARLDNIEKPKIVKSSLDELRRFYSHFSNTYDQLRVKALAMIAGEVAIVTFIFAGADSNSMPLDADRKIFYFTGITLLAITFGMLLWTIASFSWIIPHDLYDTEKLYKKFETEHEFLEYLHDDYISSIKHCLPQVEKRAKRFNWTIYLLSIGVIILLVIKFGGPHYDSRNQHHQGSIDSHSQNSTNF